VSINATGYGSGLGGVRDSHGGHEDPADQGHQKELHCCQGLHKEGCDELRYPIPCMVEVEVQPGQDVDVHDDDDGVV
jgi:hypothetical protein